MLKFMPLRCVLDMNETIPTGRRTKNCGGTCSPVDRTYVTAMPATATSTMVENHIKTHSMVAWCCSCMQNIHRNALHCS